MNIITILLFFAYTIGAGYSVTYFLKNSDNFFERWLRRVGIGMGAIPFVLVLLNLFHIPVDWRIVLVLSLAIPAFFLVFGIKKGFKLPNVRLTRSNIYFLIVMVIFFLSLFMYVKGSFIYPYLEDYDPWAHAVGVKYVSIEKNFEDINDRLVYLNPYPPGYNGFLGVLHQTSPSLMWTIKFFNAFIISIGLIFFYFFTKNFMRSKDKALMATLILAMIPSYLSHFIWAHSLVVTLLIVALYCLTMIDKDKRWIYPTMVVIAGIALTQPSQAMKFSIIFMIYFIVKSFYSRKFCVREFLAIIGGYLLSLTWWAVNSKGLAGGYFFGRFRGQSTDVASNIFVRVWGSLQKVFPPTSGSATRPYSLGDFFIAKSQNMINNPIGIGIVICLLFLLAVVVLMLNYKSIGKERKVQVSSSFFWFLFAFLGVNSLTFHLPFGFYSFRFWMLLALPVSIIAAEGFWFIVGFFKQLKVPKIATFLILVLLIFLTSGRQKYDVNTAMWGPGADFATFEDSVSHGWLRANLPPDTKVFSYSADEKAIVFDMFSCAWCDDVKSFRGELLNKNVSELYSWLKMKDYEYLTIDGTAFNVLSYSFGENRTKELLPKRFEEISSFDKFQVVYRTDSTVIFRIL